MDKAILHSLLVFKSRPYLKNVFERSLGSCFYFGGTSNQECASWERDRREALSSYWLEIRVTVQAHTVGSDLFGDITNPMLAFCYDFEVAWIFHQQL